ncbi:hypothetical protein A3D77_08115 [Candidatus Gottesmanbacteria bacterium RIFCSPHIGHO2_02_FULL_39_11]|uniref:Uncharacterized protein n=1 Tax=Candidatus Gottesmanbacteria bacterium RIFCSPHIGHO2_02_FULL_39_11 TaxID=1798382 RepID=A0A1F5ZW93_9BACT|nr:MAG: hypothetical protein A3D77_08115 [Candidatus Gottesmanbacteria bacterium RIFCSPHIGHO2_02_FULL_39_11]
MSKLNWLLTLSSLNVILVTIERFSFTTQILLPPDNFLRLHEVFQIATLILFTVILPALYLKELTKNFELLKKRKGAILLLVFIAGVYFYATGNGIHELGSFFFNQYCPTQNFSSIQCKGMFINDYYFGNGLYFFGAALLVIPLLMFERISGTDKVSKKDKIILIVNSIFYSLTIFAYAAFDRVEVGLIYSLVMMVVTLGFFIKIRKKMWNYPFITYSTIAYTLGGLFSLIVRLIRT